MISIREISHAFVCFAFSIQKCFINYSIIIGVMTVLCKVNMPHLTAAPVNMGDYGPDDRHSFLNYAVDHENASNNESKIVLIDLADFEKHLNNVDIHEELHSSRYRLIVRTDHHYTVVDIDKRTNPHSCLILDATNDPRMFSIYCIAKQSNFNAFCFSGLSMAPTIKLQYDAHSCSMFALDHCIQLSYTQSNPQFHQMLSAKASETDSLFWDELPPNFLWNIQSLKTLELYSKTLVEHDCDALDKNLPNGSSLKQYLSQGVCTYKEEGTEVSRNESINLNIFAPIIKKWSEEEKANEEEESVQSAQEFKHRYHDVIAQNSSQSPLAAPIFLSRSVSPSKFR